MVPNLFRLVLAVYEFGGPVGGGRWDFETREGVGQFQEAVVLALHEADPDFGHLRKRPGQNQYHGHAVDAALYRSTGQTVDFIVGASADEGEAFSPKIGWLVNVDDHYSASDWIDPDDDSQPAPTPPLPTLPIVSYPGDAFGTQIGEVLFADYATAKEAPNAGMGVWFLRTCWDVANEGLTPQQSVVKHRRDWLEALGLRP